MKKFQFQFERLLKIKEHQEMKAKQEYAAVLQKKISLERENEEMEADIYRYNEAGFNSLEVGGKIDYLTIASQNMFEEGVKVKTAHNNLKKVELNESLGGLKDNLTAAMRERKKLDKLKEKEEAKYKAEYLKHETNMLDESSYLGKSRH